MGRVLRAAIPRAARRHSMHGSSRFERNSHAKRGSTGWLAKSCDPRSNKPATDAKSTARSKATCKTRDQVDWLSERRCDKPCHANATPSPWSIRSDAGGLHLPDESEPAGGSDLQYGALRRQLWKRPPVSESLSAHLERPERPAAGRRSAFHAQMNGPGRASSTGAASFSSLLYLDCAESGIADAVQA